MPLAVEQREVRRAQSYAAWAHRSELPAHAVLTAARWRGGPPRASLRMQEVAEQASAVHRRSRPPERALAPEA